MQNPIKLNRESQEEKEQQHFAEMVREHPYRPMSYYIVTYGCQMNAHDSEILAGILSEMDMTAAKDRLSADLVLFNTCCVRDNAERRALGNIAWIKELRKRNPRLILGVCGCMVQEPGMAEKLLKHYRFLNFAFGTTNMHRLPEMVYRAITENGTAVEIDQRDTIIEDMPVQRLRPEAAYVNIMYGCNNFCSYCIVPYVRGRERSREVSDILREIEGLQKNGVKEIMLLGQNVNSYGKNLSAPVSFAELLKLVESTGMERIRFMTSHPKDLSPELIDVMASSSTILPQFHLPVQSGNDEILAKMNRHYTVQQYLDKVEQLRRAIPGIGLTTDIIVGFPGETEEQFQDTLNLVEQVKFDSAFTFIFSPRNGTPAAAMEGQLPKEVTSERIGRLIRLQEKCQQEAMQRFKGGEEQVLAEGFSRKTTSQISGKGRYGLSVTFSGGADDIGKIIPVKITDVKCNTLVGVKTGKEEEK